jgi:hypothetical protein
MDLSTLKRAGTLILVLLCAILVATALSNIIMSALGLSGVVAFVMGFIVYAVLFFGVLYLFERFLGITIFHFKNW